MYAAAKPETKCCHLVSKKLIIQGVVNINPLIYDGGTDGNLKIYSYSTLIYLCVTSERLSSRNIPFDS